MKDMIKVRDLKYGDLVDLQGTLPCEYNDPLKEFELGKVDEVMEETDDCFVVAFENMTAVALPPDYELSVERDEK